MTQIILGNKVREKIFLLNYFFWQNTFLGTIRLFGGLFLIILGIFIMFSTIQNSKLISFISILYGIFYTLRPFIFLYFNRKNFETIVFEITVSEKSIVIKEENEEDEIEFYSFSSIKKFKNIYSLKYNSKSSIYLPIEQLKDWEIGILNNNIR